MSFVEQEIREQAEAIERFLAAERAHVDALAPELLRSDVRYLLIASRGSSGNAARYAQYVLGSANRLPVAFSTPSLYTFYDTPPRLDGALVLGISQSGESPDVVSVLAEARRQGRPTLAITNVVDSPLGEAAEWTLPLHAGDEHAVAATKTYLNSVAALRRAHEAGALTVSIAGAAGSPLAEVADHELVLDVGPEVISGSTRLKAGTAQKLVLNTISTVAFVKLGKTLGNLMVDVQPANAKLRARARQAVALATGASESDVEHAIAAAGGDTKVAIVALSSGVDADEARSRLEAAGGNVRKAL